ncbi:hypothetical protein [Bacillus pinisoli]|uniref:hypothetical protein n=1 Tax=Bacillus pinisoli TaxID=2901866 RepID=UPI001FF2CFB4|nr:hypothetical protein [Bacillus pinisoli]
MKDIFVEQKDGYVTLFNKGNRTFPFVEVFLNGKYVGLYKLETNSKLRVPLDEELKSYVLSGYLQNDLEISPFSHRMNISTPENEKQIESDYRAGDILVACDNVGGLPYGYMGHSALVVDKENIIEAVISDPIVRKAPISDFTKYHPMYAHFRPKNQEMGEKAATYAEKYLKKFEEYKKEGQSKPLFYFTISTPITDEWKYIYCSKLVWLSYHYGANYSFPVDHLWFSPEDLYTILSRSDEFEVMYVHPDFQFFIDI